MRDLFLRALRYLSANCDLKWCITADTVFKQEATTNDKDLGWQDIEPSAFDRSDKRTLADLRDILQDVKEIYINARTCKELSRDENAWCMDVVQPLVRLVLKLYGNGKWWFQSV